LKLFLVIPLIFILFLAPAFGELLSDKTGLLKRLSIEIDGQTFSIETISNFDILEYEFDKNQEKLTILIDSGLEDNLSELIIPIDLLHGDFIFYLDDVKHDMKVQTSDKISFITLNFTGIGNHKIEIIATEILTEIEELSIITELEIEEPTKINESENGGGCLIATATYGSEMTLEVQQLRELRDNSLLQTKSGTSFMEVFNDVYYSFSPIIADMEREHPVFKEIIKLAITPMISSLSVLNYVDMDSEAEVLGYGISLIILNVGMYLGIPAILIIGVHRKFS
jgi:hypothetical protein